MSVHVIYNCDGCFATTEPIHLGSKFVGINGRSYGFGKRHYEQPKDKAPDGWVAYDLIGCCYCPTCAADLEDK